MTFVMDAQFVNGECESITLDSGAGVHVWPKTKQPEGKVLPRKAGLRMVAANGTNIQNYGQKEICFRGVEQRPAMVFSGQA